MFNIIMLALCHQNTLILQKLEKVLDTASKKTKEVLNQGREGIVDASKEIKNAITKKDSQQQIEEGAGKTKEIDYVDALATAQKQMDLDHVIDKEEKRMAGLMGLTIQEGPTAGIQDYLQVVKHTNKKNGQGQNGQGIS